ncbi:Protein of unknown function [Desulfonatronum thiosulfatophilum]|uniref:Mu-like prophage FluMu protein gp27 n=1 Tax=Desulfonatronum thiosulfatophilum TaxID=617002 RepID=A0A1G6A5W0_9BACT|nr:DUF3486 family protein [Desulfonatronum thiosulfatophilum]SDB03827.1 Protein of unknown function [Desulfonatronum thiosulfatophilum]
MEHKKRQQSSIDRLPEDIREQLQELLRDPRVTQLDATARINAILEEQGQEPLSKSAVNRYAVKMEAVGAKLRQSREVARMWIGRLGAEPQGEVGKLLNEMVRTLAFEAVVEMSEGSEAVEPRMIRDLAVAIEKLEKAASENVKREEEIRKKALEEAGDRVAKLAKKGGLSEETVREIRERIMGVAS